VESVLEIGAMSVMMIAKELEERIAKALEERRSEVQEESLQLAAGCLPRHFE